VTGYNVDANFTPVLLTAMHTCFMSHLLVLVLVLLQLVLTTILLETESGTEISVWRLQHLLLVVTVPACVSTTVARRGKT